jgi:hypothetical protein
MKLHERRAEIMVQAQMVSVTASPAERIGALLSIHDHAAEALADEGVVVPCLDGKDPIDGAG